MADKDGKADGAKEGAAAAKKKGKGKLFVIIGVALALLLGGGGAAAYYVLGKKHHEAQAEDGDEEEVADAAKEEAKDPTKPVVKAKTKKKKKKKRDSAPVFVELDMFTANLKDAEDDRFIQVKLVAEVRDAPAGEALKTMMPAVRNEILLLLGSKEVRDVASREGKEKLAAEIVAAANKSLAGTPSADGVESVNFTHIIVQ